MSKQSLIELLKNTAAGWLAPSNIEPPVEILGHEFSLYHIKQVTFDEDSPRKEAFENVLNALAIEGVIFTYLLLGNKKQVNFYFGIAKNKRHRGSLSLEVDDIGEMILKPSLEGNFRGSVVEKLEKIQRNEVKDIIGSFTHISKLEGVPNVHEDNEQFQGVDRLVDIMSGDEFCLAVLADPLSLLEINKIESELHNIYDKLMPLAKKSIQSGENESKSIGEAEGKTVTDSTGTNDNLSITQNTGKSVSVTSGTSDSGSSKQTSKSAAETDHDKYRSGSEATSKGTTVSKAIAINTGSN
ncbi:ATP-binding protein, partial [Vibrio metschnikovii]|nr:ATP-binding protein [Vibrio metschnikovii]